MAYDANDPADRKIVADAVAEALEEARTEHEADVEGLKNKNKDLLTKLNKARREGGEGSAEEVTRLESELETAQTALRDAQSKLRTAERDLKNVTGERDTANGALETERTTARNLVIENGLTAALTEAKVAPQFMDAAKALLAKDVTVKETDGKREAFVGDKPLGAFVSEWSQGDKGKHYVTAPANGGGGAGDNKPAGEAGSKKIGEMNLAERTAHYNKVGEAEFNRQLEAERTAGK
ncbi:hypothetical protein UFOVP131_36 [uncultured Caudovirales phage]|uniref:Uncharacterized protein n=1 Tax=uncultured Caudovirales phage TaxID=2100421 RepID=A0A6J5LCH3_9CAUD|nr:hypothetical protein UFOVP131_36 [uncultured Caudovirales phage]